MLVTIVFYSLILPFFFPPCKYMFFLISAVIYCFYMGIAEITHIENFRTFATRKLNTALCQNTEV